MKAQTNAQQASNFAIIKRIIGMLFHYYPVLFPLTIACIVLQALCAGTPMIFFQQILAIVSSVWQSGSWAQVAPQITLLVRELLVIVIIIIIASYAWGQLGAILTQGALTKIREDMFNHMQDLPISYFDTHAHGDIMSCYTNDVDTLRQLISVSMPQILATTTTLVTIFCVMLYYSVWMTLVILAGCFLMLITGSSLGSKSAKNFIAQQKSVGAIEGYIEEMMEGQRVIKVFTREQAVEKQFDVLNEQLFCDARKANNYANVLMPILMNMGNFLYVFVVFIGGILLSFNVSNLSFSGLPLTIAIVVPFLNAAKQFTGQIGQVSNQVNAVVMGIAGARRIFNLLDAQQEQDEGYVTLVNARKNADGELEECSERTGTWAWKHPHHDGSISYEELRGEVVLDDVDFGYKLGHTVLHNVSVHAKPGQKVALVGATGAGKTTITNLLNRFYDIADGKIRYDGINITKIKKSDLRKSLGMVLQDTNLFYGSVMDNIRYGRLSATDAECIEAAKLAGADDFITRLPESYDTILSANGSQLSQGQRQLIAIARAAVADPPVMILDEATSSIDTRTEEIVQRGMDNLMRGRTTFVIAHRLSTIHNSDLILVLDHGRVIERGNHDELIAQKGTYYQLYTGAFELE